MTEHGHSCGAGAQCDVDKPCCLACGLAAIVRQLRLVTPPESIALVDFGPQNNIDYKIAVQCPGWHQIYVGVSGDLILGGDGFTNVTLRSIAAGLWHPLPQKTNVISSASTASGLIVGFNR